MTERSKTRLAVLAEHQLLEAVALPQGLEVHLAAGDGAVAGGAERSGMVGWSGPIHSGTGRQSYSCPSLPETRLARAGIHTGGQRKRRRPDLVQALWKGERRGREVAQRIRQATDPILAEHQRAIT
jgi:hypothetical protein